MNDYQIQGSKAWKDWRKDKIGSSEVPAILGECKWKSPYKLWREKTGRDEVVVTPAMEHGTKTEPYARQWYEETTGEAVFPEVKVHPEIEWLIASLDGKTISGKIVEFKSPFNPKNHHLAKSGVVPSHYYGQLQCQLFVAGSSEADFVSFYNGEGVIIPVKRDEAYIAGMLPKLHDFYQYVLTDTYPEAPDEEVSAETYDKIVQLKEAKEQMDYWKTQYDLIKDELIISNNNHPFSAHGVQLIKSTVKGAVDYAAIPALDGLDLEQYRKPSREQWTVKISL